MRVLLSSRQTGGQFTMIEGVMPPGGDGGLHLHLREDESMFIVEGELEVTIGDEVVTLSAGSSYFAPRGVPQRLRNRGSVPMRGIVIATPGGFDEFIAKAGVPLAAGAPMPPDVPPTPEQIAGLVALAGEYGIEILVPPGA
jgi:mannose-6-phosphate isomerase-like protein (cupin superfamily)